MYGITSIQRLNRQAQEASEILAKHQTPKTAEQAAIEDAEIARLIEAKRAERATA